MIPARRTSIFVFAACLHLLTNRVSNSAEFAFPFLSYSNSAQAGFTNQVRQSHAATNGPTKSATVSSLTSGLTTAGSVVGSRPDVIRLVAFSISDADGFPQPDARSSAQLNGYVDIEQEPFEFEDEPVVITVNMSISSNVGPVIDTVPTTNVALGVGVSVDINGFHADPTKLANGETVFLAGRTNESLFIGFGAATESSDNVLNIGEQLHYGVALLQLQLFPGDVDSPELPPNESEILPLPMAPIQITPPTSTSAPGMWVSRFEQVPTGQLITGIAAAGAKYHADGASIITGIAEFPTGQGGGMTVSVGDVTLPQVFQPGQSLVFSDFAAELGGTLIQHNGALGVQSFVMAASTPETIQAPVFFDIALSFSTAQSNLTMTSLVRDADFDGDADVDGTDFLSWQRGQGALGTAAHVAGDANGDRNIDVLDLAVWSSQFGLNSSVMITTVPEPASSISLAAAVIGGSCRGRRRVKSI